MLNLFKVNISIIRAYNACDWKQFTNLLNELLEKVPVVDLFTKRRYIWNIIRPRDFYKSMAHYVINLFTDDNNKDTRLANELIHVMVTTTKSDKIKKSFIWNITKQISVLSYDTLPFLSSEKIHSMVISTKTVYTDDILLPLLSEIDSLQTELNQLF